VSAPPRDLRQITAAARGAACPACGAAPPGDRAPRGTHAARLLTLPSLQGGDSWTRRASPARRRGVASAGDLAAAAALALPSAVPAAWEDAA
jgi:hypothetical protein